MPCDENSGQNAGETAALGEPVPPAMADPEGGRPDVQPARPGCNVAAAYGVIAVDASETCIFANRAALQVLNLAPEQVVGRYLPGLVRPARHSGPESPVRRCLIRGEAYRGGNDEWELRGQRARRVELTILPIAGLGTRPADGAAIVFHGVPLAADAPRQSQAHHADESWPDLVDTLDLFLASVREQQRQHVLCMVSLDHSRPFTDRNGPVGRPAPRCGLADGLRQNLRPGDRLEPLPNGDFAILLQDCTLASGLLMARGLRDVIRGLQCEQDGRSFAPGASFGIAPVDPASPDGATVLAAALAACRASKGPMAAQAAAT
jgi:GGDEF domain-containing protein